LVNLPGTPVVSAPVQIHRKPLPQLVPIHQPSRTAVLTPEMELKRKFPKYPAGMLHRRHWFPPKLRYMRAILPTEVLSSLKQCKVVADRSCVDQHLFTDSGTTLVHARPKMLLDFIRNDLQDQKFTDITLKTDSADGKVFRVHKLVLAAHSSKFGRILRQMDLDGASDACLVLAGVDDEVLEQVVNALYLGYVVLSGKEKLKAFEDILQSLQALGILLNLRPSLLKTSDGDSSTTLNMNDPASDVDSFVNDNDESAEGVQESQVDVEEQEETEWEVCSFGKPGPRRSKRVPIPRRFSSGSEHEESDKPPEPTPNPDLKPKDDESKPLSLSRVRPKRRRSDVDEAKCELNVVQAEPSPVKRNKKEEEMIQQAVKTSPRLRQKATAITNSETESKNKIAAKTTKMSKNVEIKSKEEDSTTTTTTFAKKKVETTSPSRPQRKRDCVVAKTVSSERKRKSCSDTSKADNDANSPNFDAVSDDLLNDKVKVGQLEFVQWLIDTGFLRATPPRCCDVSSSLKTNDEMSDGVAWTCDVCGLGQSVRVGSIFAKSGDESLCWIMRLILCWSDNTRFGIKFKKY